MCDTNQISKHFRKPFFIKGQKKELSKRRFFFCSKEVEKTKKTGDAKVDKKLQKPSQREGRKNGTRKMCYFPQKEKQNKENRVKNGEKKKMKKRRGRHKPGERNKKKKGWKREIHKRGVSKGCERNAKKTRMNKFFRKERKPFCTRKDFSSR